MPEASNSLPRSDLINLQNRYDAKVRDYLSLYYQYLNFYTGLLSTIIGVTIAGILQASRGELRSLVLLVGPVITVTIAKVGYNNVKVMYARAVEAWVTMRNIEEMLGDTFVNKLEGSNHQPLFLNKQGGFIARIEQHPFEETIRVAHKQGLNAGQIVIRLIEVGNSVKFAKITFGVFLAASVVLSVIIVLITCNLV